MTENSCESKLRMDNFCEKPDGENNEEEKPASRLRPRLADALDGLDFDSMPLVDVYGSRFKERAEAQDKINKEVAKSLYDWKPSCTVNREEAAGKVEEKQGTANLEDNTKPDIIIANPSPPPKPVKPKRQSKKTKEILREIDRIKAAALADVESMPETLMDDDIMDDEVFSKIEKELEYNRTMTVRITDHRGNLKKYTMLMRESFVKIFTDLAQEHNIEQDQVMLTFKDVFIKVYDTPTSIGLCIGDLIEFCKLSKPMHAPLTEMDKANRVTLKVQSATSRKRIEITINKVDPLLRLMKEYCKASGQDLDKLSFKFDDEYISPDTTANDLELEDGYCIDVIESK